jgi:hypothetical protein
VRQKFILGSLGFAYGGVLAFLVFACAGMGHGSYVPWAVSSAPLGALGIAVGFFGIPVSWMFFALLAGNSSRIPFLILMVSRFVVATILIVLQSESGILMYIEKVPEFFLAWLAFQIFAEIALWRIYFKKKLLVAFWFEEDWPSPKPWT